MGGIERASEGRGGSERGIRTYEIYLSIFNPGKIFAVTENKCYLRPIFI